MDLFAAEIGMDPAEVRRRNLIQVRRLPLHQATGTTYDVGDYERALDLALEQPATPSCAPSRPSAARPATSCSSGSASPSTSRSPPARPRARSSPRSRSRPTVRPPSTPAARPTGRVTTPRSRCSPARSSASRWTQIRVVHGRHRPRRRGWGTMGSRSLQLGGSAVHKAPMGLVEKAKAGRRRRCSRPTPTTSCSTRRPVGSTSPAPRPSAGRGPSWPAPRRRRRSAHGHHRLPGQQPHVPLRCPRRRGRRRHRDRQGACCAATSPCDDAGRILNPLLADGQRHGGIAQGAAQALLEEVRYDEDGNPVTSNLADYAAISATELPSFELVRHGDADADATRWAPRGSASPARSAPRRPCSPRSSTRSCPSASATSTCPPPERIGGGRPRRRPAPD